MTDTLHCKNCQIVYIGEETDYLSPDQPCCPRCQSENFEVFRRDGVIVKLD